MASHRTPKRLTSRLPDLDLRALSCKSKRSYFLANPMRDIPESVGTYCAADHDHDQGCLVPDMVPAARIWWLSPFAMFLLVTGGTIVAAVLTPAKVYQEEFGTPKYVGWAHVGLAGLAAVAFFTGCRVAGGVRGRRSEVRDQTDLRPPTSPESWNDTLCRWFYVTGGLSLAGYVIWLGIAYHRGLSFSMVAEMIGNPSAAGARR